MRVLFIPRSICIVSPLRLIWTFQKEHFSTILLSCSIRRGDFKSVRFCFKWVFRGKKKVEWVPSMGEEAEQLSGCVPSPNSTSGLQAGWGANGFIQQQHWKTSNMDRAHGGGRPRQWVPSGLQWRRLRSLPEFLNASSSSCLGSEASRPHYQSEWFVSHFWPWPIMSNFTSKLRKMAPIELGMCVRVFSKCTF